MFDTVKVGKIISQKRKEHNMTQLALADKLGVSFQAVSNWERGNSMPDISKLPELAALFGCSIEELLGGGQPAERVEKIAKGEAGDMSLGELAEVAPVLMPDQLDEAVQHAARSGEPEEGAEEDAEDEGAGAEEDQDEDGDEAPRSRRGERKERKAKRRRIGELVALAPFLSKERLEQIAEEFLDGGYSVGDLIPLALFLSEEMLNKFAERAEAGDGDVIALAPFLSQETLGKIAARTEMASGTLVGLAPFLSKAALNELVLTALERGEKINQGLLPFLSEDVLIEAIRRRTKQ